MYRLFLFFLFMVIHENCNATLPNRATYKCIDGSFVSSKSVFEIFKNNTQVCQLQSYSTIDKENAKKGIFISPLGQKETQAIVEYCVNPTEKIKILPSTFEDLCKLWRAAEYFRPVGQINNNNNNVHNKEQLFSSLKNEIAFKLAQHLVDNVTPENIEAIKNSELPPKLAKRVNRYVASHYAVQSLTNDLLGNPAHQLTLGELKLLLNPEGDKVVITNNVADNGMIVDRGGSVLGAFIALEKNAVTAFGRNGVFAYPTKNNATNQDCIIVNNLQTQATVATIDFGQGSVCRMKFSPDSTKLAIIANQLTLWDANNGSTTIFPLMSQYQKYEISFGQGYLGVCSAAGDSFIIDIATKQVAKDFRNETEKIIALAFQPTSNKYVTLDKKGSVYQHDVHSDNTEKLFEQKVGYATLSFSRDGNYLITQLEKKIDAYPTRSILNFYHTGKKRTIKTIETTNMCDGVALLGKNNFLVKDGSTIKIYSVSKDQPIEQFTHFSGSFSFNDDQNAMIIQHQNGNIHWGNLRPEIPAWKLYRSLKVVEQELLNPGTGNKELSRLLGTPSEPNTLDLSAQRGKEEEKVK